MHDFRYIGNNTLITRAKNGYLYTFPADDVSVGLHLMSAGEHEPWLLPIFKRLVSPGDNVVIVGSNVGYHDVALAKLVYGDPRSGIDAGIVFGFEPNTEVLPLLKRNLQMNGCGNSVVCNKAATNNQGQATLYHTEGDYGGASLFVTDNNSRGPMIHRDVDTTVLDAELAGVKIKLLKIDAEGSEAYVLQGAAGMIGQELVDDIIIENNLDYYVEALDAEVDYLRSIGYISWLLDPSTLTYKYTGTMKDAPTGYDILFTKRWS